MKTSMQMMREFTNIVVDRIKKENLNPYEAIKLISTEIDYKLISENQQIIDAHFAGWSDAYDYLKSDSNDKPRQAEEYYEDIYKQ